MNKIAKDHLCGFTLLELLVTLSLFSAIMGFLMSTFFQFHQQSQRMESMLKLRQEVRILERIIRNDLQTVIYLTEFMKDAPNERDDRKSGILGLDEIVGEKDGDQLHMHVNNRSRFQRFLAADADPEIHEVSYFLETTNAGEGVRFKRREEFYIDDDISTGDRSITHTLSDHVVGFNVQYFRSGEDEPLNEWDSSDYKESKKSADRLPTGVLVTLELRSEEGEELASQLRINLQPDMGGKVTWR